MTRDEALQLLAHDSDKRRMVLAPSRRTGQALFAQLGCVEPIAASVWIAAMDRALSDLEGPLPLQRALGSRTLLVDKAWTLPNVDILLILEISRRIGLDLILVDDPERFQITSIMAGPGTAALAAGDPARPHAPHWRLTRR